MKKLLLIVLFLLFSNILIGQVILSQNIGNDVKFKGMFSCEQTEWWAREFILSDFGITENQDFIIKKGSFAVNYSFSGASYQFNIYEIDENFPSSFDENNLLGSSEIGDIPSASFISELVDVTFKNPIIVPSSVKRILVEVKKTVTLNNPAIALATIAGTDEDRGFSWYKGCVNIGNGNGYQATTNFRGSLKRPDARFYITVNGEPKTIFPFEIVNNNNCENEINKFSLTNQTKIKSVVWGFDDPTSGVNNTSTQIDVNHQFTNSGIYNVTATVTHIDNTVYTIPKGIEIFEAPNINTTTSLKQCDNSDIDGFSFFNLNEVKGKIITNPENYTITFHEEKSIAENNGTIITNITNYKNKQVSNDKIWARVENLKGCSRVSEINLFVSTTQIPLNLSKSIYKCDTDSNKNDGITIFNFSDVTNEIINIFPVNQQLDITYYKNEDDALAEQNKITNIASYRNVGYPNQQNIYVRVDSKVDNNCLGLGAYISLHVEKNPVANKVTINPECDNDRDGFYAFDTSNIQSTIIGNQTDVTISYFDENGAQLSSPLPNPFSTKSQKIKVKVENSTSLDQDGKCSAETEINFIVNTVPFANTILPQEVCDNDFDGVFNFDSSAIESTIIGNQTGLIVKYFDENNNPLPSPLPNPFNTATQTIKVRLENPLYDVCFEEVMIDFIVNKKPNFDLISEATICITNNPKLELAVENPSDKYSYTWKDDSGNVVGNLSATEVSKGGIYSVVATSLAGCNSEEKSIIVKESSISRITLNDIEVQDDSSNNFIKINTANLGLGDYEFRLLDTNLNIIYDFQNNPYFENLDGGVYVLELNDKNGCGTILFDIALISFPDFFTPNKDNKNDYWQIKGINKSYYKSGKIDIFNRYGKLISSFTINDIGWDGTYNGIALASNTYWFQAVLINQKDEIKTRKGMFSLVR